MKKCTFVEWESKRSSDNMDWESKNDKLSEYSQYVG